MTRSDTIRLRMCVVLLSLTIVVVTSHAVIATASDTHHLTTKHPSSVNHRAYDILSFDVSGRWCCVYDADTRPLLVLTLMLTMRRVILTCRVVSCTQMTSRCETGPGAKTPIVLDSRRVVSPGPSMSRSRFLDAIARLQESRRQLEAEPKPTPLETTADINQHVRRMRRLQAQVHHSERGVWFAYCQLDRRQRIDLSPRMAEALGRVSDTTLASSPSTHHASVQLSQQWKEHPSSSSSLPILPPFHPAAAPAISTMVDSQAARLGGQTDDQAVDWSSPAWIGLEFVTHELQAEPSRREKAKAWLTRKALEFIALLPERDRGKALELLMKIGKAVDPIIDFITSAAAATDNEAAEVDLVIAGVMMRCRSPARDYPKPLDVSSTRSNTDQP
jgi:hypothetical protein